MPGTEIVAVNQCSGNSRGFFNPRVAGGQLANGAMGCARFTGVPLRMVLDKAGVKAGAVQVAFEGLDGPVLPETPDFAKALTLDHARDGEVMLAWSMNGQDLPGSTASPCASSFLAITGPTGSSTSTRSPSSTSPSKASG